MALCACGAMTESWSQPGSVLPGADRKGSSALCVLQSAGCGLLQKNGFSQVYLAQIDNPA